MAREDAVARELGQPPDQDLVERIAVRRDERVQCGVLDQASGADLGDPVSTDDDSRRLPRCRPRT